MFKYDKKLEYPICITKKDLKMAKYLIEQFGGANGELAASFRYFSQKFTMPDDKGKALLNDIATEELSHIEMICTMVHQLTKNATYEELEKAGLGAYYTQHGVSLYPQDATGNPFTAAYFASVGDVIAIGQSAIEMGQHLYINSVASEKCVMAYLLDKARLERPNATNVMPSDVTDIDAESFLLMEFKVVPITDIKASFDYSINRIDPFEIK